MNRTQLNAVCHRIGMGILGVTALALLTHCDSKKKSESSENNSAAPAGSVEYEPQGNSHVTTENPGYDRVHSRLMVRRVTKPTEANLDYAAYVANVMLLDPLEVSVQPEGKVGFDKLRFNGLAMEVQGTLQATSLSKEEKGQLIAWTPALDRLLQWDFSATASLADAYSKVTSERWNDTSDVSLAYQEFSELAFHRNGDSCEVWAKLEFKSWMTPFLDGPVDADEDGFAEAWLKLDPKLFTTAMAKELLGSYSTTVLDSAGVWTWARNLTSRWYPSYNTDIWEMQPGQSWPDPMVPPKVLQAIGTYRVEAPTVVFRGRPFDDTLFNIFLVGSQPEKKAITGSAPESQPAVQETASTSMDVDKKTDSSAAQRAQQMSIAIGKQLKNHGPTWEAWGKKMGAFHKRVQTFAQTEPAELAGLIGEKGFLVFRRELDYLQAPDWQSAEAKHHPMPVIVDLKEQLAKQGIDFLFIPIPTKLDVYPEMVGAKSSEVPGGIAQPFVRKVLQDLSQAGVETVDLLTPFLKQRGDLASKNPLLYQFEDTHWSEQGLRLAASTLAARVREYPWYASSYAKPYTYTFKDTSYTVLGDIQSRLSDAKKSQIRPETVTARQVLQDGNLYQDQDTAPVLILGDSYSGVFQTVGCRHAGVTAQLAAELKGPVDLVMGWGGGPEAPRKLAKHGPDFLKPKRLVVWMMSARDLFAYPGNWAKE